MQRWGPGGPYAAPCPAAHGGSARPRGGRDRPPYIAAENGQRPVNGSRLQRPTAGRCKHRPLRRGRVAAGRMRRPGRALPPCFAGCAAARRVRRPGRAFARPGAAPLRRLRRHLPLQGRLLGGQCPQRPVGPVVGRILLADAGIGSCAGKALGAKGKPPRRQMRAEGAGGQKKRSPALKVSMGPDQRARTAAALSLV